MSIKIVNDGLPSWMLDIVKKNFYDGPKINCIASVTGFNNPVRIAVYRNSGEVKASSRLFTVKGNMAHNLFEDTLRGSDRYEVEKRIYTPITIDGETVYISGQFDLFDKERSLLLDYKTMSFSKYKLNITDKKDNSFPDYRRQLSIMNWMLKQPSSFFLEQDDSGDIKGVDGKWGKNTQAGFEELKKYVESDKQWKYKPSIMKSVEAAAGFQGGNMTEENFDEKELDLMRTLAVRDGKIQNSFNYDDVRENSALAGKEVTDYGDNLGDVMESFDAVSLSLVLGQMCLSLLIIVRL